MINIARKSIETIVAEKFLDLVILKNQLYIGEKIKARIIPRIIESKIGFKRKKDKTNRIANTTAVMILLK